MQLYSPPLHKTTNGSPQNIAVPPPPARQNYKRFLTKCSCTPSPRYTKLQTVPHKIQLYSLPPLHITTKGSPQNTAVLFPPATQNYKRFPPKYSSTPSLRYTKLQKVSHKIQLYSSPRYTKQQTVPHKIQLYPLTPLHKTTNCSPQNIAVPIPPLNKTLSAIYDPAARKSN